MFSQCLFWIKLENKHKLSRKTISKGKQINLFQTASSFFDDVIYLLLCAKKAKKKKIMRYMTTLQDNKIITLDYNFANLEDKFNNKLG